MSTEANFDNRGGRDSRSPIFPLPPAILEILARQEARMDELLEQERARCRQELAETLKAQEGRIYEEMRRKLINEELPRIRLLLRQQLTPLVMEELRAGDGQGHPRGLRRSRSEAHLDDEEENYNQSIPSHDSKRVRTGLVPISMRRSPNISFQSYPEDHFPSLSPKRHSIKSQSSRQHSPLSRAAQAYLPTERAIPNIEKDVTPLTEEQLKDAGRCLGYYSRSSDDGRRETEGFTPLNSDNLPRENPGVDRPLTPFARQNGVASEEDSLSDKFNTPSAGASAGLSVQDRSPHEAPPLRQPQEPENTFGLVGRIPHGWYASRTDILQKTCDTFPHERWGLSSEFRPLLVFYDNSHILIECEGLHFFWHEPTNSLERIDSPEELQEILKQMDHGRLLPRGTFIPAQYKAPLLLMELIRAENLLYWNTPEIVHRRRSSIDRALRQGLIRLGSESSIHEPAANNSNERDEENGENPDALFGRFSDLAKDSREMGYDAFSEDNNAQEKSFDHPAAIFTPSSSSPSPLEEGTTLNNPIDLVSSSPTLQGRPAYDRYTRPNSERQFFHADAYERHWGGVQGVPRHRGSIPDSKPESESKSKSESKCESKSGEDFEDHNVGDRYNDWDMSREGTGYWRAIKRQIGRDEEQYP